jgi:hypothetical protein|tara:strand:- start:688 stop:1086 length:399 start_codon:yes stop_codon:yes gene_type:complete
MKDNFDLYNWKQGKNPTDSSKGEFDLYEWNKKRYLNELELDQEDDSVNQDDESGSVNIDRGGDDAKMGAELESDSNVVGEAEEKEYEVEYWILTNGGYDNEYITVNAKSEEDAIMKAKEETRRGKDFKIYKR